MFFNIVGLCGFLIAPPDTDLRISILADDRRHQRKSFSWSGGSKLSSPSKDIYCRIPVDVNQKVDLRCHLVSVSPLDWIQYLKPSLHNKKTIQFCSRVQLAMFCWPGWVGTKQPNHAGASLRVTILVSRQTVITTAIERLSKTVSLAPLIMFSVLQATCGSHIATSDIGSHWIQYLSLTGSTPLSLKVWI